MLNSYLVNVTTSDRVSENLICVFTSNYNLITYDFFEGPITRQSDDVSKLITSPGSHWAMTSNGRQHTSQSVVNRWLGTLVSMATSEGWPQNGQAMDS